MKRIGWSEIIASLHYRKSAYFSLVLEVALGCTVVAYVLGLRAGLHDIAENPLGFDVERTFVATFEQSNKPGEFEVRVESEQRELRALPGVEAVSFVELPPLSRREFPEPVRYRDQTLVAWSLRGGPSLSSALALPLAQGRTLSASDALEQSSVPVMVTKTMADRLGPTPLGAKLQSPSLGPLTVVGVIDSPLRLGSFLSGPCNVMVMASAPLPARRVEYLVRTSGAASAGFAQLAQRRLSASRPDGFVRVQHMAETRAAIERNLVGADTVIYITVLGMVLVVLVGSLGMASSLIVERTRQIGIRRALGARRSDIIAYFMLESLFATLFGLLFGAGMCALLDAALVSIRGSLVIQWSHYLPLAAGMFVLCGQLAALIPAWRAAGIAPSVVSRS